VLGFSWVHVFPFCDKLVEVLGHEAAIWCVGNRTFVLVAREPRRDVERMASFVQASLR